MNGNQQVCWQTLENERGFLHYPHQTYWEDPETAVGPSRRPSGRVVRTSLFR